MKINNYLIKFALTLIVMFGGTFVIHYFKTGELLLDQIIGFSVGLLILTFSLIWRKTNKLT
ncbi:hypothetical protein [Bacillus sp. AFS017336]|uniref:hypothetical protein n=1 Tax=Bacillus sp. AFS017336 TaxID=2033489 RepID=UPI000BF22C88|nr:hypothetical protein [Bacillus sp. AFS017336]PEJ53810.1 hypothetical protein CN692_21110 [Bacillus sp. AFS002410]PEL11718.1 hypothetical protein CN601_09935 [Bacillus sp. AFS017336]